MALTYDDDDHLIEQTCRELDDYQDMMRRQESYIDALLDQQLEAQPNLVKHQLNIAHDDDDDESDHQDPFVGMNIDEASLHKHQCVAWRVYPIYDRFRHIVGYDCKNESLSDVIVLDHLKKQRRDAEIKEAYKRTLAHKDRRMAVLVLYHHRLQRATLYLVKYEYNQNKHYGQYRLMTKYISRLNQVTMHEARQHCWPAQAISMDMSDIDESNSSSR